MQSTQPIGEVEIEHLDRDRLVIRALVMTQDLFLLEDPTPAP